MTFSLPFSARDVHLSSPPLRVRNTNSRRRRRRPRLAQKEYGKREKKKSKTDEKETRRKANERGRTKKRQDKVYRGGLHPTQICCLKIGSYADRIPHRRVSKFRHTPVAPVLLLVVFVVMPYSSSSEVANPSERRASGLDSSVATGSSSSHMAEPSRNAVSGDEARDSLDQPSSAWQRLGQFYERNFGLFLVFLAEVFASLVRPELPPFEPFLLLPVVSGMTDGQVRR